MSLASSTHCSCKLVQGVGIHSPPWEDYRAYVLSVELSSTSSVGGMLLHSYTILVTTFHLYTWLKEVSKDISLHENMWDSCRTVTKHECVLSNLRINIIVAVHELLLNGIYIHTFIRSLLTNCGTLFARPVLSHVIFPAHRAGSNIYTEAMTIRGCSYRGVLTNSDVSDIVLKLCILSIAIL